MTTQAQHLAQRYNPSVRSPHWMHLHGGHAQASIYAQGFWQAVIDVTPRLQQPLHAVLDVLVQHRQQLAINMLGIPGNFGKAPPQFGWMRTFIGPRYRRLAYVQDFLQHFPRNAADFAPHVQSDLAGWRIMGQLDDGTRVPLTRIDRAWVGVLFYATPLPVWHHPRATRATQERVQKLFERATAPHATQAHMLRAVARLHWWLIHTPFMRGTASIADMLCAALLQHHGVQFAGWRDHVAADVVALVTPNVEAFAALYPDLMR